MLNDKRTLRWSDVGDEVVVLDDQAGELFRFSAEAGFIWKQLQEGISAAGISAALVREFAVDAASAQRDVRVFLQRLDDLDLRDGARIERLKPKEMAHD
ncbi:MAG TPA: PqqD family protein [Elusimicrobiota bacterium]|nr:PqqD family protein [Elusimicrobiota bacterium]